MSLKNFLISEPLFLFKKKLSLYEPEELKLPQRRMTINESREQGGFDTLLPLL